MKNKRTLLIVDDEKDIREIFSLIYADDFKVMTADSGRSAFEIYKNNNIDIILTDLKMPNGDGAFLAQSITSFVDKSPCPVFMMTANLEYDYQELLKMGIQVIFSKPFDFDQFLKVSDFYLSAKQDKEYSRKYHRALCTMTVKAYLPKSIEEGTLLNISPEGFLIKLPPTAEIQVGDSISIVTQESNEEEMGCPIQADSECRWISQHSEMIFAGFKIEKSEKIDQIIHCFNLHQTQRGEFN